MIEIKNLNFKFNNRHILKNIDLTLNDGEIIGVVGRAGSGKSLFMKIISGIIRDFEGDVHHNGRSLISYMKSERIKIVSYMNNDIPENPDDTIFNFTLLSRIPYKNIFKPFSEYDIQITEDFLKALGLYHIRESKLGQLSDSMFKTVQIAHSFIRDGEILVLDNPTSDIDIYTTGLIRKLIRKYTINGDKIVIIASSDLNFILQSVDRVIVLDEGAIFEDGTPDMLDADMVKKYFATDVLISRNIYNGRPEVHIFPED